MKKRHRFSPPWADAPPRPGTYRSLFKWGAPDEFKHPNQHLYGLMKLTFGMSDADFQARRDTGDEEIRLEQPCRLSHDVLRDLREILGEENLKTDDLSRASVAYGKTLLDVWRLRKGIIENPPDAVAHPRSAGDVRRLVAYCSGKRIPLTTYGGGSSVTRGVECVRGGISVDMRTHMHRILSLNTEDQTVTVEPGIYGPALEEALNQAPERYHTPHRYTCGHFPQSFEYSTVGGWVVTRGAGQNSTYYGKIEHLVVSQKYVTPRGDIETFYAPAEATGPDIDQIMIGSEGAYGILVEVTLKVFRYLPHARRLFSYCFKDWESGLMACRQVMQGEFGFPSVFRLSDAEETDVAMKLYGIEGTLLDKTLTLLGYRPGARCLLLGSTDGDKAKGRLVARRIGAICRRHGAIYTTGLVTKAWEQGRFRDPYLRDDLGDFDIILDTLECAATWSNLLRVWAGVREYIHSRPQTICMAHMSHFYPQGANLYFIFMARMNEIQEYLDFHAGILDTIQRLGATMSHHHGIGKLLAPWLEGQIGRNQVEVLRALKRHFDPSNIMNPGGTLALDVDSGGR